mmetsp:Transcript_15231/g.30882  ORF Transcript_15231/g.30882 Transcript_15231/m.30882 type:complete len:501 (-) Transcript_15231:932-2434(-)
MRNEGWTAKSGGRTSDEVMIRNRLSVWTLSSYRAERGRRGDGEGITCHRDCANEPKDGRNEGRCMQRQMPFVNRYFPPLFFCSLSQLSGGKERCEETEIPSLRPAPFMFITFGHHRLEPSPIPVSRSLDQQSLCSFSLFCFFLQHITSHSSRQTPCHTRHCNPFLSSQPSDPTSRLRSKSRLGRQSALATSVCRLWSLSFSSLVVVIGPRKVEMVNHRSVRPSCRGTGAYQSLQLSAAIHRRLGNLEETLVRRVGGREADCRPTPSPSYPLATRPSASVCPPLVLPSPFLLEASPFHHQNRGRGKGGHTCRPPPGGGGCCTGLVGLWCLLCVCAHSPSSLRRGRAKIGSGSEMDSLRRNIHSLRACRLPFKCCFMFILALLLFSLRVNSRYPLWRISRNFATSNLPRRRNGDAPGFVRGKQLFLRGHPCLTHPLAVFFVSISTYSPPPSSCFTISPPHWMKVLKSSFVLSHPSERCCHLGGLLLSGVPVRDERSRQRVRE